MLIILLISLCACTEKNSGADSSLVTDNNDKNNMLIKAKPDNVYSVYYFEGKFPGNDYISSISTSGDKIYVSTFFSRPKESAEDSAYESGVALYSMNLDGSDFKEVVSFTDSNTENEDGSSVYRATTNLTPCPDGSTSVL